MTEKLLTFPSPTSPDPGDGVLRSKFNFFPVQHQHNPTPPRYLYRDNMRRSRNFFVRGGGGVQAPQLILQFKDGFQWFYYTFSRGGSNFFQPGVGLQ